MNVQIAESQFVGDKLLVSLVREVVIDHKDIEDILKTYQISSEQWDRIKSSPRFAKLLETELVAWNSATNTEERTRLKAAAMIEEWLVEAYRLLHDKTEALSSKTRLAELISKIGGHGQRAQDGEGGGGERFSVTINLGADANLKFEKVSQGKVIDVDVETVGDDQ